VIPLAAMSAPETLVICDELTAFGAVTHDLVTTTSSKLLTSSS
tara:strand:+ start:406 stop:534 length:129 start_codon:yes stop_codon:yes gene_type:complete